MEEELWEGLVSSNVMKFTVWTFQESNKHQHQQDKATVHKAWLTKVFFQMISSLSWTILRVPLKWITLQTFEDGCQGKFTKNGQQFEAVDVLREAIFTTLSIGSWTYAAHKSKYRVDNIVQSIIFCILSFCAGLDHVCPVVSCCLVWGHILSFSIL